MLIMQLSNSNHALYFSSRSSEQWLRELNLNEDNMYKPNTTVSEGLNSSFNKFLEKN